MKNLFKTAAEVAQQSLQDADQACEHAAHHVQAMEKRLAGAHVRRRAAEDALGAGEVEAEAGRRVDLRALRDELRDAEADEALRERHASRARVALRASQEARRAGAHERLREAVKAEVVAISDGLQALATGPNARLLALYQEIVALVGPQAAEECRQFWPELQLHGESRLSHFRAYAESHLGIRLTAAKEGA
jgi:hypothetical protein